MPQTKRVSIDDKPVVESVDDPNFITLPLSKPIQVFDEQLSELRLRKPTGADLIRVGNPVTFDPISDPPKITHDMPLMCKMIARLASIPTMAIDQMAPEDIVMVAWNLSPHFLPRPGTA